MKILGDYHTHTRFSNGGNDKRRHATGTIEENVKSAIEKGLKTIGISEHGFSHNFYGLTPENAKIQRKKIDELNKKYPEIEILMGIEANILDDTGNIDVPKDLLHLFDYVLAGYHYGSKPTGFLNLLHHADNLIFGGRVFSKKYNTRALVNAMRKNNIKYITHPGDKGIIDIDTVAKVAEETSTGLEINGHHKKLNSDMIKKIMHRKIDFYIGSDAHRPDHIANFDEAIKIVDASGIDKSRIVNILEVE